MRDFLTRVLGSTEQIWARDLRQAAARAISRRGLVAYTGGTQTACGAGQAAMGPFYCPNDQTIYIDPDFFNELSRRFQAPGDFAAAYVIAHEVGHHVQNLEGTLDQAQQAQQSVGRTEGNQIQVGVELQADCYAGVWAANARDAQGNILEPGDVEEGMRAAEAIGDDMLQKQTQGVVVPESFTHGSSAQRMEALQTGLEDRQPGLLQVQPLETDQHLPDVLAAEQAEEGVGHLLEAVDDSFLRLDLAARHAAVPSRGRIRPSATGSRRR